MKNWRELFIFTKKERIGVLTLLLLTAIVIAAPLFLKPRASGPSAPLLLTAIITENLPETQADTVQNALTKTAASNFNFDPNTATLNDFIQLGLSEKTAGTILNYRNKGGYFKQPDDLRKMYGIKKEEADRLIPYIQIKPSKQVKNLEAFTQKKSFYEGAVKPAVFQKASIEINSADSAAFDALYGIGPKLSARIISFRERLGGFYNVDQIKEVYGLPDSTFRNILPRLSCNNKLVKKIDINSADNRTLGRHPYIGYQYAGMILQYKKQHGNFKAVDDLYNLEGIKEEDLKKMLPYLTAGESIEN